MKPGRQRKILSIYIVILLIICGVQNIFGQGPDDYFAGHGFVGNGDTVFTNSGTFWDDGYTADYDPNGSWDVYFCTTGGNPYPITIEFSGYATHYGGGIPAGAGEYAAWDYLNIRYNPSANYFAYHDDTPEFSFTSQDGCIRFTMNTNGDAQVHDGWEAEIYAIPPPPNNEPCGATLLTVGNICTPQVFSNKGAYNTGTYATPCHDYFGGDIWFSAVIPASGNLKVESFPGTLEWAVMNLYTGSSCGGLSHYACIEDSVGMPTAHLTGFTPGDTVFIRMFGDQAKSGTFGICASDPVAQIDGHTGPAGIGDDSTNVLWLRADLGVLNNSDLEAIGGEAVKTWQDQSGNQNHLAQSTGSQQAVLTEAIIDNMPVLRLDGTDDYMMAELSTQSAPFTLITVSRFTSTAADEHLMSMGDEINPSKSVSISRETDNRYYTYTNSTKYYGPTLANNTAYLLHAVHDIVPTRHELYLNEAAQSPSDYPASVITDGSLRIGASRAGSNFFGGDIAELIIYKQYLNSAQKIIIENSLASKYGISIATDRYAHEPTHKFDVAGIGRVDLNNIHTEAQSSRTLSIGNPTDLDDNEFILFGHDKGDISNWTSTERPNDNPNLQRIAREWRVDITGDPGPVTITLSDSILPAQLPGFNNFILWTDADGDFSSGAIPIPLIKVDGEYVANSVNLADDYYLTIGSIMPVVSFSVDSSSGLESLTNPSIEVSLNFPVNAEISVVFRAVDGTAAGGGVDYLLNPGSATFAAGSSTTSIVPTIIDDTIVEIPDEYFTIILSDPDAGLTLSADSTHTCTILNNDINVSASTDTDTISNCGTLSANLSTSVEGTGPYTYSWTPVSGLSSAGIANPVATPATDTWYKISVTDLTNGAVGSDSIHITVIPQPAKPVITAGGSTTFCAGDSLQLSSSPGFSWLWSDGRTTQDIYVSAAGSYTVKITDEYGCESELSDPEVITLNSIPATPVITPSDTSICPGDSARLVSSEGDSWLWSSGETSQGIWVKTATDYHVRIQSAAGCWSDTSLLASLSFKTPPAAPTITASGPTSFCPGDSVDLTSSTGDTWLWSNLETTQTIRVKSAGSFTVSITDATTCQSPSSSATDVVIHPVPPAPVITAGGSTDICENDSVSLSSSSGTEYLWSTAEITGTIYARAAGDYTVQVSNPEGCWSPPSTATTITTQAAPAKPTVSFSGPTQFCIGDSLVLSSSAGSSYHWSTAETTSSITAKVTADYWVKVSNALGCYSLGSDPLSITVNELPSKPLIGGDTEYCAGDSIELSAPAATTYLWSTGETASAIFVRSGSYTLTVGDAIGCLSPISDPAVITENPLPAKPVISGDSSYCQGGSSSLMTGTATSYYWSTTETTRSISATAGTYTVRIADANSCESPLSDPFPVTETPKPAKPTITADGPLDIWLGDSVKLSSSTASAYLWSPGSETTRDIMVKTAGDYSVTIADANGCQSDASDPVSVTVNSLDKPIISIIGDITFCEGSPGAILNSSDAFSWEWSNGETTQRISPLISGSYTVRILNELGHYSEPSDPVTITVNANPVASLLTSSDVLCNGEATGSAEVSGTGGTIPYTYNWSGGQSGSSAVGLASGLHTATISDVNQCQDTVHIRIAEPEAILVEETIVQPYCEDSYDGSLEITVSGGTPSYFITWSDGSLGMRLEDMGPGSLDLELIDGNQCRFTKSYTLASANESCVTIYEIITPNNDGYNDTWMIPGLEYYPNATVEVYDQWGKQVFYSRGYDQPWDGTYDGRILPMASYHYVVNLNNGSAAIIGNITIMK